MTPEARAYTDASPRRWPAAELLPGRHLRRRTHYLKAVKAAGTSEAKAVMAKMRELPINDFMTRNGSIRADGRVIRDMYLMQAKPPEESKGAWDLVKMVATVPGNEAFRPLAEGGCPLVTRRGRAGGARLLRLDAGGLQRRLPDRELLLHVGRERLRRGRFRNEAVPRIAP